MILMHRFPCIFAENGAHGGWQMLAFGVACGWFCTGLKGNHSLSAGSDPLDKGGDSIHHTDVVAYWIPYASRHSQGDGSQGVCEWRDPVYSPAISSECIQCICMAVWCILHARIGLFRKLPIGIACILYTFKTGCILYKISEWQDCVYWIQTWTYTPQLLNGTAWILDTSQIER